MFYTYFAVVLYSYKAYNTFFLYVGCIALFIDHTKLNTLNKQRIILSSLYLCFFCVLILSFILLFHDPHKSGGSNNNLKLLFWNLHRRPLTEPITTAKAAHAHTQPL